MKLIYTATIFSVFTLASCGGGDDSPPPPVTPPVAEVPAPKATTLIFPENNTECNEGVIVNDEISSVTFRWEVSADTDTYEVNLRNLNTDENSSITVRAQEVDIRIFRGVPYEWFVISKASGTTEIANSPIFKFYNQGPGVENYAPFPAEVVNPARGANLTNSGGNVTLEWTGTDVDNDIESYEVFFGTSETPTESLGTTTEETMNATITVGGVYYWRVVSTDSQGNASQSEIFEFMVSS